MPTFSNSRSSRLFLPKRKDMADPNATQLERKSKETISDPICIPASAATINWAVGQTSQYVTWVPPTSPSTAAASGSDIWNMFQGTANTQKIRIPVDGLWDFYFVWNTTDSVDFNLAGDLQIAFTSDGGFSPFPGYSVIIKGNSKAFKAADIGVSNTMIDLYMAVPLHANDIVAYEGTVGNLAAGGVHDTEPSFATFSWRGPYPQRF